MPVAILSGARVAEAGVVEPERSGARTVCVRWR